MKFCNQRQPGYGKFICEYDLPFSTTDIFNTSDYASYRRLFLCIRHIALFQRPLHHRGHLRFKQRDIATATATATGTATSTATGIRIAVQSNEGVHRVARQNECALKTHATDATLLILSEGRKKQNEDIANMQPLHE